MTIGGKLTIETANVYLDRNYALIRPEVTPGNYAMLAVSDTGCGMSPEVLNHVFQPFFTTKESGKGTGLGLATVYGIVKQWGGHLSIYSEPGLGSSFKVYLPQSARQQAATETNEALSVLPGGSETILVVEDDKAVRAMTTRILRTCGYSILDAGGGKLAINVAQQYEGQIDLLLTDVVMPQIGGKRLADRLSVLRPGIRILYISGYTDETVARHGVLRAETAFLQKPFAPRALAEKVRDVLDSPGPEDPPK
jgi:CheY-like chemotaxis protein